MPVYILHEDSINNTHPVTRAIGFITHSTPLAKMTFKEFLDLAAVVECITSRALFFVIITRKTSIVERKKAAFDTSRPIKQPHGLAIASQANHA